MTLAVGSPLVNGESRYAQLPSKRLAVGEAKETNVDTSKDKGSSKNSSQQKDGKGQSRDTDRSRPSGDSMREQDRSDRSRSSNDR